MDAVIPDWVGDGHWLLTSASAKVDLTRRLRAALNAAGKRLYATDVSPIAPALYEADGAFLCRRNDDHRYIDDLIQACRERDIRVIVPTRDADFPALLAHAATLDAAQIWLLASPLATVQLCQDKVAFHAHCTAHGLPVLPRLTAPDATRLPVFFRPRQGAAGEGALRVDGLGEWQGLPADGLVQPWCGLPEYTVDALFDWDGQPLQWVCRRRLRVVGGESQVSQVCAVPALDALVLALSSAYVLHGPATIQAFYGDAGGPWLIEINPRFGGACALSIEAGLATPERLVALVRGDAVQARAVRPIREGLMHLRYSVDRFVTPENLLPPDVST